MGSAAAKVLRFLRFNFGSFFAHRLGGGGAHANPWDFSGILMSAGTANALAEIAKIAGLLT
jgi:hypothetical protein